MLVFGLIWVASQLEFLVASGQNLLLKAPLHFFNDLSQTVVSEFIPVSVRAVSTSSQILTPAARFLAAPQNTLTLPLSLWTQSPFPESERAESLTATLSQHNPTATLFFQLEPDFADSVSCPNSQTCTPFLAFVKSTAIQTAGESSSTLALEVSAEGFSSGSLETPTFAPVVAVRPLVGTGEAENSEVSRFQVWVQGYLVAEFPTATAAGLVATQLRQVLHSPDFDPADLQPALVNDTPVGRVGDRLLFVIDSDLATALNRDPADLAISWINNLRQALDTPPLTLAQAQIQMHGLIETNEMIEGLASWYGPYFHGRLTATGEIFDQNDLTAAHPSLPFDTYLKVTNLLTGDEVVVRVNDRGPYFGSRSLDLSQEAARVINSESVGVIPYRATVLLPPDPQDSPFPRAWARSTTSLDSAAN